MYRKMEKQKCTGCSACLNICPKHCISMEYDEEGFLYPIIDTEKCVNCRRCEEICPILQDGEQRSKPKIQAYAAFHREDSIRRQSSSGGIFTLIAKHVIENNGVVYGAAFDAQGQVHHVEISNKAELGRVRGAKYVQSQLDDMFARAERYLKEEKPVLFSGTPCQIAGFRSYLGKDYPNLLLIDVICHGVPSPKVWKEYLEYQAIKHKTRLEGNGRICFRDKSTGWRGYSLLLDFGSGKRYQKRASEDDYMRAFIQNYTLRPSCYQCQCKLEQSAADFTLGDFWGIEKVIPQWSDNKGVSVVFVHTNKGKELFTALRESMICTEVSVEQAVKQNPSAILAATEPKERKVFIETVSKYGFEKAVKEYLKITVIKKYMSKVKRKIRGVLNHVQR